MNQILIKMSLLFIVGSLCSCTSVPAMESRLQSIRLYDNLYIVQAGETFETIAFRYRMPVSELRALNPAIQGQLVAGSRLNVRPGTTLAQNARNPIPARSAYTPAPQQRVITAQPQPQANVNRYSSVVVEPVPLPQQVVVQPVISQPVISQPVETVINRPVEKVITEIPAASWSADAVVVDDGSRFREEVIPDTLDSSIEPIASNAQVVGNNAQVVTNVAQPVVNEWVWPTDGQVARAFEPSKAGGQGVDIAGVPGQDVRAAMAGTVVYSGRDLSGGGNLIIVRHPNNLMTTYSNADNLYVAEDDQVLSGDPIASLGSSVNNESVLRFEVRREGNPLDPMKFLPLR